MSVEVKQIEDDNFEVTVSSDEVSFYGAKTIGGKLIFQPTIFTNF